MKVLQTMAIQCLKKKGIAYELTVDYVYEDGSEVKPSVKLYLAEGQTYNVDSYNIDGYYTDNIEYSGIMPDGDLNFRVMYYKTPEYTDSALNLYNNYIKNGQQATESGCYSVSNVEDLTAFADYVKAGGNTKSVSFIQTKDIDVGETAIKTIGTVLHPFSGIYNGQSLTITGLTINSTDSYTGLFGCSDGATINDVILKGININGTDYVGCLVGRLLNSHINGCETVGVVSGNSYVGGIAGSMENSTIENSYNSAYINGSSAVGGLVGNALSGYLLNSYNSGNVGSADSANTGGIVGITDNAIIENVYNTGIVSGASNIGAIAGVTTASISNCYYLSDASDAAFGSGASDNCEAFTSETDLITLLDKLNAWVCNQATSEFAVWDMSETYPTLGTEYDGWIMDIKLNSNKLQFTYNSDAKLLGIMYIALYDSTGKLLKCEIYNQSGVYTVDWTKDSVKSVKAFLWDEDMTPLANCISRTVE